MSRTVTENGALVYEGWSQGEKEDYLALWPSYGCLLESHAYPPGQTTIRWYFSREDACSACSQEIREHFLTGEDYIDLTPEGSIGDAHIALHEGGSPPPAWIANLYEEAKAQEDTRWWYVQLESPPVSSSMDHWLDDPNTALSGDFVCGPFQTKEAAHTARTILATDPDAAGRGWVPIVGWSYDYNPSQVRADGLFNTAHRTARLSDGPFLHRAATHLDPSTLRRFELCRSFLFHGGLIGGEPLESILSLHTPWPVPEWVPESPLSGALSRGTQDPCWIVPDHPQDPWNVGYPGTAWAMMAARYVLSIQSLSREDEYGFSVPQLVWYPDPDRPRPLVIHTTCTGNTTLLASENVITGWSWTREEIAGVQLTYGPAPEWLRDCK